MDEECTGQMAWRRTAAAEEGLTPPHNGTGGWDQPQERLKRHGADALKDCELMAIVLGTGYRGHAVLDPEILAANIEYSRFPPLPGRNLETGSYPGLLRAAIYIGAVADPHFLLKMRRIFLQATESGVADQLGYPTPEEFFTAYTTVFWSILYPLIIDGMELLKYTGEGRGWLANMHAHLLIEQNREHPA